MVCTARYVASVSRILPGNSSACASASAMAMDTSVAVTTCRTTMMTFPWLPCGCARRAARSGRQHHFEAAEDHALAVERHAARLHHIGQSLILHDLGHDAVALRPRLVDDIGEHHRLAALELDAARERRPLAHLDVVGDAFAHFERTVLAPDFCRLLRQAAVSVELLGRHRNDKSIDVGHWGLLRRNGLAL